MSPKKCRIILTGAVFLILCLFAGVTNFEIFKPNSKIIECKNSSVPSSTLDLSQLDSATVGFLKNYVKYCEEELRPTDRDGLCLCPCIAPSLEGEIQVSEFAPSFEQLEEMNPDVKDGMWTPRSCLPRHRIALLIPFSNREHHLRIFLNAINAFLQKQLIQYRIFVIEQKEPYIFNKGMLQNAGFLEAAKWGEVDCFIFHDVDLLPVNDLNFYVCTPSPRHVGAYVDKWKYNALYNNMFGGATAFTKAQFKLINGYSNNFDGWGGEDDDLRQRVLYKKMGISRYPQSVGRYRMIKHERDIQNPVNSHGEKGWIYRPETYDIDGLNSLKYKVLSTSVNKLYVNVSVALIKAKK